MSEGQWELHQGQSTICTAADFEQAACLIEQTADLIAKRGEIATLRAWLETLPAVVVRAR
jgi:ATP/maltotriose-dependent transcriptional regulator MalT